MSLSVVGAQAALGRPARFKLLAALTRFATCVACSVSLIGCDQPERPRELDAAQAHAVLQSYADIAHASYDDATRDVRSLLAALDALLAAPSRDSLAVAQTAWRTARKSYTQTEVFRFYGGPIDAVEPRVNAWPIDENYVEAGASGGGPGLIEDVEHHPEITQALMASQNQAAGETSVSAGFHVIELLLWDRDRSTDGPGARAASDFVSAAATESPEERARAALALRRGQYLRVATELLATDLAQVAAAWSPQNGSYRDEFLRRAPADALGLVIKGSGTLSGPELSGERLTVPYETRDQENEHSCFSDNTHEDLAGSAQGIANVCLGRYVRSDGRVVSGAGLCALVTALDPVLGQQLEQRIETSVSATRQLPAPFDRALLEPDSAAGRTAIARAMTALAEQAESFARVAALLRVGISSSTQVKR